MLEKKVAVFSVGLIIVSNKEKVRKEAEFYPDKVADGLKTINKASFAGKSEKNNWLMKMLGRLVLGIEPGDYRDWNKIEDWTESVIKLI